MAERMRSRMFRDVARYAYVAPDGRILYFESDGQKSSDGELPPGTDPAMVEAQGFTFLDRDAYVRTQRSLDPAARAEEAEADELATAFDASMGQATGTPGGEDRDTLQDLLDSKAAEQRAQNNGQQNGTLDPQTLAILQRYMDEGRLEELFQPFQQEQSILEQQMALGQQARQPGRMRPTPAGSALSSISNVIGNVGGAAQQRQALEGQRELGRRMQAEASGRTAALLELIQRARGIDPRTGLMGQAVGDVELSQITGGRR